MIHVEWTTPAFTQLETLPQKLSFEIIKRADTLSIFPEMGTSLEIYSAHLKGYRQLVINRKYRLIYKFDRGKQTVFALFIQPCRQQLPSTKELKRRLKP